MKNGVESYTQPDFTSVTVENFYSSQLDFRDK